MNAGGLSALLIRVLYWTSPVHESSTNHPKKVLLRWHFLFCLGGMRAAKTKLILIQGSKARLEATMKDRLFPGKKDEHFRITLRPNENLGEVGKFRNAP